MRELNTISILKELNKKIEFKPIKGYEDLYAINALGVLINARTDNEIPYQNLIYLTKNNKTKSYSKYTVLKTVFGEVPLLDDSTYIQNVNKRYSINKLGKIVDVKTNKPVATYLDKNKYVCVKLLGKKYKLHELLANTYLNNPNLSTIAYHVDGNKNNNIIENIAWQI